jgi:hypothetical protein
MSRTTTYNPKQVIISCGPHLVSGYAEDSFITIAPKGDGTQSKTGCDGEVIRAIDPSEQFTITLTLLQGSRSNSFFSGKSREDKASGDGYFPIMVKDLRGGEIFSADSCWVVKVADFGRGRADTNRAWTIDTGSGVLNE